MAIGYGSISITDLMDKNFTWNLLKATPKLESNASYNAYQFYTDDSLEATTYVLQLWDVVLDEASVGLRPYWGGGTIQMKSSYSLPDENGYICIVWTATESDLSRSGAGNKYISIYNFAKNHTGQNMTIGKWKLEKSDVPTEWSPHPDDLKGSDGASITGVTNYYLATSASSGVTHETEGWTTNPAADSATMTSTNKYLWNYEVVYSGQTIISATTPCIIGRYGTDGSPGSAGKGITSITEHYKATNDPTNAPTSGWSPSPEATSASNPYLWNYETINYTDGSHEDTNARVIGTQGTSVTVSTVQYQEGTSATVQPTGTWSSTPVDVAYGNFLWTKVTYSDGKVAYSVAKQGADFSMNLLRDTAQPTRSELWGNHGRSAVIDGMMTITPTSSAGYAKFITPYLPYGDLKNKTYTFSFDAREIAPSNESYTSGKLVAYIGVQPIEYVETTGNLNANHDRYEYVMFDNVGTDWKRYSITKKIPDGLTNGTTEALIDTSCVVVQIGKSSSRWPVQVKNLKLEQAENPTPWSPNENDLKGSSIRGVYIRDNWTNSNWNTYGTVGRTGNWNNYDIDSSGTTGAQKFAISDWNVGDLYQATGTATNTGIAYTITGTVTAKPSPSATTFAYKVLSLSHSDKGDKGDPGSSLSISASALSFINYARISETPAYTPSSIVLTPLLTNLTGGGWYYKTPADASYTAATSGSHGITISGGNLYIAATSDLFTNSNSQITFKYQDSTGDYIDTLSVTRFTYPDATMSAHNTAITNNTNNIKLIASANELNQFSNNYTLAEQLAAVRVATDGVTLAASRAYSIGGTQTQYVVYDTGESYSVNDLAIYQGGVYKCIKAIASATDSTAPIENDGTLNTEYWQDVSSTHGMDKIVQNMSDFMVSAEGISSVVTETKGLVDESRNLMVGTLYPDVSTATNRPHILGQGDYTRTNEDNVTAAEHGFRVTNRNKERLYIRFGSPNALESLNGLTPGETYTLSFDAAWKILSENTSSSVPAHMSVWLYDDSETTGTSKIDIQHIFATVEQADKGTPMTGRCEFTFTLPSNVTMARFYISNDGQTTGSYYGNSDYIELSNIKLEVGDHATPWCAATQDLNGIDGATMVSQINQTASTVQISANHVKIGSGDTLTMSSGGVMNLNAGTMNINGATVNIGTNSSTTDAINIGNNTMGTITLDPSNQTSTFKIASADGATYFDLENSEFVAGNGGVTINGDGIYLNTDTHAKIFSIEQYDGSDVSMELDFHSLIFNDVFAEIELSSTVGLVVSGYQMNSGRIRGNDGSWSGGTLSSITSYDTAIVSRRPNYSQGELEVHIGWEGQLSPNFQLRSMGISQAKFVTDTCSTKTDTSDQIATDKFVWNAIKYSTVLGRTRSASGTANAADKSYKLYTQHFSLNKGDYNSSNSYSQLIMSNGHLDIAFGLPSGTCNNTNCAVFFSAAQDMGNNVVGTKYGTITSGGTSTTGWFATFSSSVSQGTSLLINALAVYFG